jgi:hypothetical protein
MKNEFIPYEQALALKELGFDEPCFGNYYTLDGKTWKFVDNRGYDYLDELYDIGSKFIILAPLYQQAFRWFREKHNILATVYSNASGYLYQWSDSVGGTDRGWSDYEGPNDGGVWNTYEEAELDCLKKLIEISTKTA